VNVFSFERKPAAPSATPHFIYADAWAAFDRLEATRTRNAASLMRSLLELLLFVVIPLAGIVLSKRHLWMIGIAWALLVLTEIAYRLHLRSRFVNWQCPRCHAEWPGTKNEKDPACRSCGLRLHQLAP
jgi:hypothetical protein